MMTPKMFEDKIEERFKVVSEAVAALKQIAPANRGVDVSRNYRIMAEALMKCIESTLKEDVNGAQLKDKKSIVQYNDKIDLCVSKLEETMNCVKLSELLGLLDEVEKNIRIAKKIAKENLIYETRSIF